MPDIATLGLRIENGQAVAAADQMKAKLDGLSVAGDRARDATGRFSSALSTSERAVMKQAQQAQEATRAVNGLGNEIERTSQKSEQGIYATRKMVLQQMQALEMNEKFGKSQLDLAETAEHHSLALGRVAKSFEHFAVEATGANEQLALLGASMGHLQFGEIALVAGLGAIFVALKVWEAWKEEADHAKEEQDKLTESLMKWYEVQKNGAAGEFPKQIEAITEKIKILRKEMDGLAEHKLLTAAGAVGQGGSKASAWIRIFTAGDLSQITQQFVAEVAKGAAVAANAVKEGGEAIEAAHKEVAKRIEEEAVKVQLERLRVITEQIDAVEQQMASGDNAVAPLMRQLDAMKMVSEQNNLEALQTEHAIALRHADADSREILANHQRAELDRVKALHDLSGIALTDRLKAIDSIEQENDAVLRQELAYKKANEARALGMEMEKQVAKIGAENATKGAAAITQIAEEIKKAQKYSDDMARIWRDGIVKILSDGTKSFRSFFEDVFQMFSKMMDRMQKASKDSGALYALTQIGAAGAAGALTGYQAGQGSTSMASGALNGGLSGAATGFMVGGPWGAVIGGLAGAAGGLLGAAKAQKEAAEAQHKAMYDAFGSLLQMNVAAGTSSQQALDIFNIKRAANDLADAIDKALPGLANQTEREKELALVRKDEVILLDKLKNAESEQNARSIEDLTIRQLVAQGHTDDIDDLRRQLEMQDAITQKRSAEYIAALALAQALEKVAAEAKKANDAFFAMADAAYAATVAARNAAWQAAQGPPDATANRGDFTNALSTMAGRFTEKFNEQIRVLQDQLKVQQDAAKTAQKSHDDTAKALDSLTKFRDSLTVGPLSVLSPLAQKNAAEQAMRTLFDAAQHGDKNAAANFGASAQSFLQLSQGYNASGAGFVNDQSAVTKMVNDLVTQYGVQETIDQRMLDSATQQIDLLQQGVDLAQQQVDAIQRAAQGITDLYDQLAGPGANGGASEVWSRLLGQTLASLVGNPGVNVPNQQGPFPFGNANGNQVTLAELFYYALTFGNQSGIGPGIPGFASGGDSSGGMFTAGERGTELIMTGGARTLNAGQTGDVFAQAMNAGRESRDAVFQLIRVQQAATKELSTKLDALLAETKTNTTTTRRGFETTKPRKTGTDS